MSTANVLMVCVVVIGAAFVGAWWLKGAGEREWNRYQAELMWLAASQRRRQAMEAFRLNLVAITEDFNRQMAALTPVLMDLQERIEKAMKNVGKGAR